MGKKDPYLKEILENVNQIEDIFMNLRDNPEQPEKLQDALTIIKVINGNADLKKYSVISAVSSGLINLIDEIIENRTRLKKDIIKLLFLTIDYYRKSAERIESGDKDILCDNLIFAFKNVTSAKQIDVGGIYQKDVLQEQYSIGNLEQVPEIDNRKKVEVSLLKVDNVINKLNDIVLNQYQLKNELDSLTDSENSLADLVERLDEISDDKKTNAVIKKNILENISSLRELRSALSNKLSQSERDTFTLQEDILSFRMIPAELINPDLNKTLDVANEKFGKKSEILFFGTSPLVDKFILQKLIRPIKNIVMNSVEFGCDNKDNVKIEIEYSESGGKVQIVIKDNGKGIDFSSFRKLCMRVFPYEVDDIEKMSDDELVKYLFYQGITTKSETGFQTDGGRGLFEAYEGIEQVKGKISIHNREDGGLETTLIVPKSLTTVNGFFVRSADEKFLIPSTFINEIIYVNKEEVIDLLTKHAVKLRNDIIPIYPLSGILKTEKTSPSDKLHIIIVDELGDKIGIIVDEILYHSSVIYKPLPQNVEKIKSLQGVVFDEEYNIVNILHIPEIIRKLKNIRNIEFREKFTSDNLKYRNVLIVDDSDINRKIEINIISKLNVNIDEAVNGIDALGKIREKHYDLIITDSKMPQMDGLTFIENMRKENEYEETPVIVLASSNEESMDMRYRNLKVYNIYNKSYFNRDVLLSTVKTLVSDKNAE